jgi:hypothetical protein
MSYNGYHVAMTAARKTIRILPGIGKKPMANQDDVRQPSELMFRTNIPKQVATLWQGELASLRVCVSGASSPKGVGILLRIVAGNMSGAKKNDIFRCGTWNSMLVCSL